MWPSRACSNVRGKDQPSDYRHRLLLALDEFPTYGYIPTIDAEVATMAGYGIKGWFLAQDIPQLDETMARKRRSGAIPTADLSCASE